ncbi:MAG: hypothetical protein JWN23_1573 [Rhodocyclales bacterium]|nr:hypothetical protein [Rhodocyclales bacterium]
MQTSSLGARPTLAALVAMAKCEPRAVTDERPKFQPACRTIYSVLEHLDTTGKTVRTIADETGFSPETVKASLYVLDECSYAAALPQKMASGAKVWVKK